MIKLSLLLLTFSFFTQANDEIIDLFYMENEHVRYVENHQKIVTQLREGDRIRFSDGKVFTLGKDLDPKRSGKTSLIFRIENGKVIRFSRYEKFLSGSPVDWTLEGYERLKHSNINLVPIYSEKSKKHEYVIQKEVQIKFNLYDFSISIDQEFHIKKKLVDFLVSTYRFTKLGDFSAENIIWDGNDWYLLDWTRHHLPFHSVQELNENALQTIESNVLFNIFSDQEQRLLNQAITNQRLREINKSDLIPKKSNHCLQLLLSAIKKWSKWMK